MDSLKNFIIELSVELNAAREKIETSGELVETYRRNWNEAIKTNTALQKTLEEMIEKNEELKKKGQRNSE